MKNDERTVARARARPCLSSASPLSSSSFLTLRVVLRSRSSFSASSRPAFTAAWADGDRAGQRAGSSRVRT